MRTSQQTGSRKETTNPISASGSRKAVVSKKRGAQPSRSVNSDNDTVICADSSAREGLLSDQDLEARIALRAHQLYEERGAVMGKIKPTGSKRNVRYWLRDEKTGVSKTKNFMHGFLLRISGNEVCAGGFLIEHGENEKVFLRHPRR
jgi:hypothetical protein